MSLTILEGSTFCICDELGDLAVELDFGTDFADIISVKQASFATRSWSHLTSRGMSASTWRSGCEPTATHGTSRRATSV